MIANGYSISFGNDESVLNLDNGNCCIAPYILKTTKLFTLNR